MARARPDALRPFSRAVISPQDGKQPRRWCRGRLSCFVALWANLAGLYQVGLHPRVSGTYGLAEFFALPGL
jgi:hypothetical protein